MSDACVHEWRLLRQWNYVGTFVNEFYCVHCLARTERSTPSPRTRYPMEQA